MPTILVVDDSAVERRLVTGLLQSDDRLQVEVAESGQAAMQRIESSPLDLVLTDLEMPDMNGLNLLKQIRIHHSDLPVIAMTAHGSEATAIRALQEGAASYVSKTHLNETLCEAVRQVLSISEANRNTAELMGCLQETHFQFELDNDPQLIEPLVGLVQHNLQGLDLDGETRRVQLGVALEQAMLNALYRGNLEITTEQIEAAREDQLRGIDSDPVNQRRGESPYCDRRIYVDVSLTPQAARFVIRDEGPGFDVTRFAGLSAEKTAQGEPGRGIILMKTLMDEVSFNDTGNEVTLVKHATNGH